MKRLCHIFVIALVAAGVFSGCSWDSGTETKGAPKEAINAPELIAKADELYKQRADLEKVREGLVLLKRVRNNDIKDFEASWKYAKFSYYLGKNSKDDKESDKILKDGIEAGEAAASIAKDRPEGYFWQGACLGARAQKSPITVGVTSVGKIKELMNKVIEIDPKYQGGSAYDALAQIEMGTRSLSGGKAEKALEYLQKAVEIEKQNSFVRLHLAEAYLALDKPADAKKELDFLLKMQPHPDYLPEYEESKQEAERLLRTRF